MPPHRRITDRIAPVDQPLLVNFIDASESRRQICKPECVFAGAIECITEPIVSNIRSDTSVGALPSVRFFECIDNLSLAQTTNLIIDCAKDSNGVADPVTLRIVCGCHLPASIADEYCIKVFPDGSQIVVNTTIAQYLPSS